MNQRQSSYMISVFVIILSAKIFISLIYMAKTFNFSNILFKEQVAVAAENKQEEKNDKDSEAKTEKSDKISKFDSVEITLDGLEKKRLYIQKEQERLEMQRYDLDALKLEIENKIEQLSTIQKKVESDLAKMEKKISEKERKKIAEHEAKIVKLVKVYSSMKPKDVAVIINKLDIDISKKLLMLMKGERAGNILSYVDSSYAAKISELLVKKK